MSTVLQGQKPGDPSNNSEKATPAVATNSENGDEKEFNPWAQEQEGDDSEEEDQMSEENDDDDDDDAENYEEDEDSMASEYSYYQSSEEEEEEIMDHVVPTTTTNAFMMAPPPNNLGSFSLTTNAKRKANNPLAELDRILDECNNVFPEAAQNNGGDIVPIPDANKCQRKAPPTPNSETPRTISATATTHKALETVATSTLIAGVGYETGAERICSSSMLAEDMNSAAKKQEELDDICLPLIQRLITFISGYDGHEGMVLLALKLSPGFNKLLFSLLKNDLLLEWGKRKIYVATLNLIDVFCSQFYVGILLHNLLEGDGTPDDGTSNIQALLGIVHAKAIIMNRSQQKMAKSSAPPEGVLANHTMEACRRIISTYEKATEAIKNGREDGIISNPNHELTSKDMGAKHPHLPGLDDEDKRPPTEEEDATTYAKEMNKYRLQHVALLEASRQGTSYRYLHEATSAAASGSVKPKRMLRITSEIAGLLSDLPCEWSSGIFVRVDDDRPDVLKACIMAPEGTPYENGCFEFDIFLPTAYPDIPPKVYLCTTSNKSVRFNPNLYSDGHVCLSLLGTWSGPGWIPNTSTLLQVLLSIQSLIFVPDPFFNEPGYTANNPPQQRQSKEYDRQIRAATLKVAILGQMKNPSALFSDCISDHFRLKKRRILKQLGEWEELEKQATTSSSTNESSASQGALVSSGGIKPSVKIVKGFCDRIRHHIDNAWPDEEKEGIGGNSE